MASFVWLYPQTYYGHLDLTSLSNRIEFDPTRNMVDFTTFGDGGYTCVKPGLISGQAVVGGFQDYATDVLDDEISVGQLGSQYAFSAIPNPTGTVTAGDSAWLSRGVVQQLNPLSGAKGEAGGFQLTHAFDTAIAQGKVLHPKTARTADGDGTAVTMTGPTSSQFLYASLHVTAYTGFTSVVFTVATDDNGGFSTPTTRITFSTVTGTTSEFKSVAGSFSSETHVRTSWDVTGSGSVSFVVTAGVI